jgi:hypothetical protein
LYCPVGPVDVEDDSATTQITSGAAELDFIFKLKLLLVETQQPTT